MKQTVKTLAAMLLIALCLTSDTAATSAAPTSTPLSNSAATGQMPLSLESPNWTPVQVMLPSEYLNP